MSGTLKHIFTALGCGVVGLVLIILARCLFTEQDDDDIEPGW